MQQNLQRLTNQLQAMQQEVRELTQLTQQLAQQGMNQWQQLQNWGAQGMGQPGDNRQMQANPFQLVRQEQATHQLLHNLTAVCQEMNQHLKHISQQMSNNQTAPNKMTFQPINSRNWAAQNIQYPQNQANQSSAHQRQAQVSEGPVNQDTTHPSSYTEVGRLTTQTPTGLLQNTASQADSGAMQAGSASLPSEADLKHHLNEYREDTSSTQYPYNRSTT